MMNKEDITPQNTVIINATNIGYKFHGLGIYSLSILRELSKLETRLNFIVYLNKSAASQIRKIHFPVNFILKWVTSKVSPDYNFRGHLLRMIFSNLISLKYRKFVQFNTSQLEINFFRSNQIVTVHDVIPLLFKKFHKKQFIYFKLLLRFGLKKARYILTPSNHSKELLQQIYNLTDDRIKVIYNGADTKTESPDKINTQLKEKYILYVGRICRMKNIRGLIESFGTVADKIPHKLIIVGNDWKAFIEELCFANIDFRLRERIIYKQDISEFEKFSLLRNADLMVFPSLYEGFGLPPIEAMANGCPVIVSNNSSLPEICGNGAYYIDPKSNAEISNAIIKVLRNSELRNELIEKGKQRAAFFKWEFSAIKHLHIFEQISECSKFPVEEKDTLFSSILNPAKNNVISEAQL